MSFSALSDHTFFVDLPSEPASAFIRELAADRYPHGLSHQDPGTCGNIDEDKSFGIYLLGHDDAHSHRLNFRALNADKWALDWTGEVDLTYYWSGTTTFKVDAQGFAFGGIDVPTALSDDDAWEFLRATCADADDFSLVDVERAEWEPRTFNKRFELFQ